MKPEQREVLQSADSGVAPLGQVGGEESFRLGYRPSLDGVRGLAIVPVVLYNLHLGMGGGYIGVDLFLVLSGFLITTLLLEERCKYGRIDFGAFYLRRALRLLPALVALLVVYCGAATVIKGPEAAREEYLSSLAALFYVGNWVLATGDGAHFEFMGPLAHTWSLSVEEQFYLLWPPVLALFLARGGNFKGVVRLAGAGVLLAASWRSLLAFEGAHPLRLYAGTDTRADALLMGCLLAALIHHRGAKWYAGASWGVSKRTLSLAAWLALILFLAGAVLLPEGGIWMHTVGFLLVAMVCVVLLAGLVADPGSRLAAAFQWKPLVVLGRVSYGVYLWHAVLGNFLNPDRLPLGRVPLAGVQISAIALAVALSWFFIERPALSLKRRYARPRPRG